MSGTFGTSSQMTLTESDQTAIGMKFDLKSELSQVSLGGVSVSSKEAKGGQKLTQTAQ
ncbi:hypothetical protein VP1G_10600 [Cytospora mali]|uniref:Uncharacterized protein n=1 Tax=Cytospora mali TaxID=578113 RepID=A0A194UPC2_CYTMA|nr:hypothetical protein VP1G_10600 [Valsa mali var. pyri (nom. inval.)]